MPSPPSQRARLVLGLGAWLALLGGGAALLASEGVRGAILRTGRALAEPWRDVPARERAFPVADVAGVELGDPVFEASGERLDAPVGHVVGRGDGTLRVRFEPDVGALDAFTLESVAPSRTLGEALASVVPPESARRLGALLRERLGATYAEALGPQLERRLPAFLERVSLRQDPRARAEVEALGAAVMERLAPLLDGLTRDVTRAVDAHFDLLERLGLVWKLVKGDGEGLRKELLPVAQEAARAWWQAHASEVLEALGQGLGARRAELGAWLTGPVWSAAQEELVLPILSAERPRLEAEAQRLLEAALAEVVLAPGGGLRPRFASVVRTHLLGHRAPLLLVRRAAPADGAVGAGR